MNTTPLHAQHLALNAKMVDFFGWSMPLQYTSQMAEHRAVRTHAGIFDVSHMVIVDVTGSDTIPFFRHLLANDINKLKTPGQAIYSCMLNEQGNVIDDLILYYLSQNHVRCIVNAACRDKDLPWMHTIAQSFNVNIELPDDLTIIALQGPKAREIAIDILPQPFNQQPPSLKPFRAFYDNNSLIARTGYTGEDGLEILLPSQQANQLWQDAIAANVTPCGLAARDTLRIEAGLNLYGQDMDEQVSPLISNLEWTLSFDDPARDFIGKAALQQQITAGLQQKLVGVVMTEAGVLRNQQTISFPNGTEGIITSGSFSPILNHAIGFARVPIDAPQQGTISQRKKQVPVQLTGLPFVRKGKVCQSLQPVQ